MFRAFLLSLIFTATTYANVPNQFTVGSYNLHGLRNIKGIQQDLNAMALVQIWAFQEVEGTFTEKTTQNILDLLPPGKWYLASQKVNLLDRKKGIWEGQVIASRFPIESVEVLPLEHTSQKQRVALIANFKTSDNSTFTFANTDHEVDLFNLNFKDRKKQLNSLKNYFLKNNSAAVITGDFNTTGGLDEIIKSEKVLKEAGFLRAPHFGKNPYTFEKFFMKSELDHFFSRGALTSPRFRFEHRVGSDHLPIYMDLAL